MVYTSTGLKRDTGRARFHMEMQLAIRKTKAKSYPGGFGGGGILTREEFVKGCETARKMASISRGRW